MFAFRQLRHLVGFARGVHYVPLILAVGVFLSVFASLPIMAEGGYRTIEQMTLTERAKSYTYYQGLSWCFGNGFVGTSDDGAGGSVTTFKDGGGPNSYGKEINEEHAASGEWFGEHFMVTLEDMTVIVGYLEDPAAMEGGEKDQLSCNNIVQQAKTLWGYANFIVFLCDFSLRTDGSCQDSPKHALWEPDRSESVERFQGNIKTKIYGGRNIALTDEEIYLLAHEAFFASAGCNAKPLSSTGRTVNGEIPGDGVGVYKGSDGKGIKTIEVKDVNKTTYYYPGTDISQKTGKETYPEDPSVIGNYNVISQMEQAGQTPPSITYTGTELVEESRSYYGLAENTVRSVYGTDFRKSCLEISEMINAKYEKYFEYMDRHQDEAATIRSGETGDVDCAASPDAPECVSRESSCAIDGIGWIVCPVVNFLAGIADSAFGFLAENFLSTPHGMLVMDDTNLTYKAWQQFVSIANVLFVIGFIVIIFSQLTGLGVSNYGVKKMLPRLILGAILINLSFIICALAVDLSNVLGYSLKNFLANIAGANIAIDTEITSNFVDGGGFTGIAGTVLLGGGAAALGVGAAGGITLALVALLGILVSAVVALIMIFFVLQIRQVAIVLLIVMSPLAFAAYLLPNTEQWFTKWRKLLVSMLLLFPIIGVVYGASSLASTVITALYTQTDDMLGQIVGAGIMILPLFVVPTLLKKSIDGIGSLGGKLNALGAKWGGGMQKGMANSGLSKSLQSQSAMKKARVGAGIYTGRDPLKRVRSAMNSRLNTSGAFNALSGGYGTTRGAKIGSLEAEEVKTAEAAATLKARSPNGPTLEAQFEKAMLDGDVTTAKATENLLMGQGGPGVKKVSEVLERVTTIDPATGKSRISEGMRRSVAGNIMANHAQAAKQKRADLLMWAAGDGAGTVKQKADDPATWAKSTAADLASLNDEAFEAAMKSGGVSVATMEALDDVRMASQLTDAKRLAMRDHVMPSSAPATPPPTTPPAP